VITRPSLTFDHPLLAGLEHPCFEARGARDGPRLSLIAGVHGCEYSSIAAVTRFMRELDTRELTGSIVAVPIVSLESFKARSPFVVPADGKNLNRAFPGRYDGSYTDALARALYETLIVGADALIDLHGGDLVEALEPFTIYEDSAVGERSRALAEAFGLPYVVRQRPQAGLGGMTCSAAAQAGVPAIIAEAGGRGQLEEEAVRLLVDGVRNALRRLGMLPGDPEPRPMRVLGEFAFVHGVRAGWWQTAVRTGQEVAEGDPLGRIHDLYGDVLEEIAAPTTGVVLWQTTSPAVGDDGLLLGIA
jgi:predicted deacylase